MAANSDSAIAKLAAKPLGTQLGILAGVIAVVGFLFWYLSYSTGEEDLKKAERRYVKYEKAQVKLKKREVEWAKMQDKKADLKRKLDTNQVSLPRAADLNSFVAHLHSQAAAAGVNVKSWSRQNEVPVAGYVKVPIAVQIVGNFHQILKYFFLLGEKQVTKRIITIENFSLAPVTKGTDDVTIKASFRATAFRQADGAVYKRPEPSKTAKKSGIDSVKAAKEKREAQVENATGEVIPGEKTEEAPAPKTGLDRLKDPGATP